MYQSMYRQRIQRAAHGNGTGTVRRRRALKSVGPKKYSPRPGAATVRPAIRLAMGCQQIAQLIKAEVGLQVAFVDVHGDGTRIRTRATG